MTTEATERSAMRLDPLSVLEDSGYRITEPRRSVVRLLNEKADGFTAEEISDELPNVGRATVYRTIKILLESGVVCKLAMPDGAPLYSMARVESSSSYGVREVREHRGVQARVDREASAGDRQGGLGGDRGAQDRGVH